MGVPGGGGSSPSSPRPGRRYRKVLLAGVLVAVYAALAVAVRTGSPLVAVDAAALRWQPALRWPEWEPLLSHWVLLGQRMVCLVVLGGWLAVRFLRDRDPRPLLVVAAATLLLNATVGAAKIAFGRLGPLQLEEAALRPGAAEVFTDGMVFPSGHAANAVVMWGLVAYLVTRHRRLAAVVAAVLAVTVGATTVYLGTHWVSDVLAGWAAGALVLLTLPTLWRLADRACRRWSAGARVRTVRPAGAVPSARLGPARPRPPAAGSGWVRDAA
ncbi:phosphatase PAP2 family protein [Blastococcus sp. SYSU DS0753]